MYIYLKEMHICLLNDISSYEIFWRVCSYEIFWRVCRCVCADMEINPGFFSPLFRPNVDMDFNLE